MRINKQEAISYLQSEEKFDTTLLIIGFSSSLSIGIDVECTHVLVNKCLSLTKDDLGKKNKPHSKCKQLVLL